MPLSAMLLSAILRLLLGLLLCASGIALAQAPVLPNGCSGSTPVATFKLYAKRDGFAPYPLREVNELEPGMKILYQPVTISGDDPEDARITLIAVESRSGAATQRVLILDSKKADRTAEWEVPFRTETVAMVFGPQGFSEGKVTELLKKDTSLVSQLADYAEQNQRVEDLINVLAEAERQPRPAESLDAALAGFASRHGTPMSQLNREAPTSEQARALMAALNPALTSYDPLAPDPSQRLQQSAGLAASVAGLFWGSQVALYAGGAGLFLNLRSLMFPGSEFRSALMQTGAEQRMTLCAKDMQRRSRTRLAYLWAARLPDTQAPGITIAEPTHVGAGLAASLPVQLSDNNLWRFVSRAQDWKLLSADGALEYPVEVVADAAGRSLRFTPPAAMQPGTYALAARWDWNALRTNGTLQVHAIPEGGGVRISSRSRTRLIENATNVEIALEGANFRFVEEATLVRKNDPYAAPRTVPFRLETQAASESRLFVLLNGEPLRRGDYQLSLKQAGGKELRTDIPVLPEPTSLTGVPLRVNVGATKQRVSLQGTYLDLIEHLESDGVQWERSAASNGETVFLATVVPGVREGSRHRLRLKLKDRPDPIEFDRAVFILGPLPHIVSSRIAHQQESGVALREGELAQGSLATALLQVEHGSTAQTLHLGCRHRAAQPEPVTLRVGESRPGARLQASSPGSLFLTFDPAAIGTQGCEITVFLETPNGRSEPALLGRVVRLPKLTALSLTDEMAGENLFAGTLTGEDLESVAKVGWNTQDGVAVTAVPRPVGGDLRKQELRISLPWPAPSPRAPLFIWMPNEQEGRQTKTRLGS
jgi:hypothetical protein